MLNSSQNKGTIHLGSLENLKYKYCIGSVIDHFKAKENKVLVILGSLYVIYYLLRIHSVQANITDNDQLLENLDENFRMKNEWCLANELWLNSNKLTSLTSKLLLVTLLTVIHLTFKFFWYFHQQNVCVLK